MRAPLSVVTLSTGETVDLAQFYAERPVVLVFLRHFGCIFCREQISSLRRFKDENVVLVSMGRIGEAEEFRRRIESPQVMISDPSKQLYDAFGLRRGSVSQLANARIVKRSLRLMGQGLRQGLPGRDPFMMAGVFRIDTDGEVSYSHFSSDASDNLSGEEIVALLHAK
ncbi:MAG TPA: peroxiredoxin-like family protein [Fimbriimonas sp.]|nr:peroxiredoxin-like family protein [Fimbriimonas sp.]